MKFYVGVTDGDWYNFLKQRQPEDINFWQPGGSFKFKVLSPGLPFLFKLKSPYDVIAGLGFFTSSTLLPLSMAWDTFGESNGADNFPDLRNKILRYRHSNVQADPDPTIGCIILTNPIFFNEPDWIRITTDWSKSIVQGKSYDTAEPVGSRLWRDVELRIANYELLKREKENKSQLILEGNIEAGYSNEFLTRVRLGQGSFRIMITDAYFRRCAVTGERTLPVLEAAHIKPFAESGPHFIRNGILLRSDIHKLFDKGYVTITGDKKVEVSNRIREEFENGREYYRYHGNDLVILPNRIGDQPDMAFLEWHNENIFRG
jgi:putative restriction endonuclease